MFYLCVLHIIDDFRVKIEVYVERYDRDRIIILFSHDNFFLHQAQGN